MMGGNFSDIDELYRLILRIFGGRKSPFALFSRTVSGKLMRRRACRQCANIERSDCSGCREGDFRELSSADIAAHINGRAAVGIYPADEKGLCRFCVLEFCGKAPAQALRLAAEICRGFSADCLKEICGYGQKARLWIFFGRGVSPEAAVFAAERVIEELAAERPELAASVSDRILPSAGRKSGFGVPVMLPLFDSGVGYSFLLDDNFEPADNTLELLRNFSPSESDFSKVGAGNEAEITLHAELCGALYLRENELSPRAAASLCRAASIINPDCGEFSDAPTVVRCFSVGGGRLILPRGINLGAVLPKAEIHTVNSGAKGKRLRLRLRRELNLWQKNGVDTAMRKSGGVITAPVGSGKTLIICSLLERLGKNALILTADKAAAMRWQRRICSELELGADGAGCVVGERDYPKGTLDIAVLGEKTPFLLAEYISLYPTVIVADCDRLRCTGETFRSVMENLCAERVYAISSRPVSESRLKNYIRLYCGETIYEMN